MRTNPLLSVVLSALGVGALAGAIAVAYASEPGEALAATSPDLERSLARLADDVGDLKSRLESIERMPAPAPAMISREPIATAPNRRDEGDAAAAPPTKPLDPEAEKEAAIAAAAKELTPELERLLLDGVPADALRKLFGEIGKNGQYDGAIAAAQALVEKSPNDPKARYLLAKAYFARCMLESTPAGFEKCGSLTLASWEKASELDPGYWEPRFERAEYLTYYPESEGKTPEVISEFERLIGDQGGANTNPRFAKSYAHLSRMYLRVGKRDKALQTLRNGVALFPEDKDLKKQLEVLEG